MDLLVAWGSEEMAAKCEAFSHATGWTIEGQDGPNSVASRYHECSMPKEGHLDFRILPSILPGISIFRSGLILCYFSTTFSLHRLLGSVTLIGIGTYATP